MYVVGYFLGVVITRINHTSCIQTTYHGLVATLVRGEIVKVKLITVCPLAKFVVTFLCEHNLVLTALLKIIKQQ